MKKFVIGFIVGALMFSIIPVMAEGELTVLPNPFPVLINGKVAQVEGYNINGYTYLKLADIGKAGLTVKFNETERQIEITSAENNESNERSEPPLETTVTIPELETEIPKPVRYYKENRLEMADYNGNKYVSIGSVSSHPNFSPRWLTYFENDTGPVTITLYESSEAMRNGNVPLIEAIPYIIFGGTSWIEYDYYINTILPLLEE